jgi:RHS repeat-associated protein
LGESGASRDGVRPPGRRVARTEGDQTTRYYYADLDNPFEVSAVRSPGGTVTALRYDADGHLVAMERGDERWYVATDQVGTPRVVSDRDGNLVRRLEWDAFGGPLPVPAAESGGPEVPIGFAGGLADPVTGLVGFGRRDYDPQAGRWTARDPIPYEGGQGNLYAYVGNDPVASVDPTGLTEPGGDSWFQTGRRAVGDAFTDVAKDAAKQYAKDSVESVRLKSLDDAHNVFQDKLKSKAEDAVKFSPRDEYLQQLERAEKNKPAVNRLTDRITNLWRRAARALGGCPEPPERRPPGPPPRLQEFKPR